MSALLDGIHLLFGHLLADSIGHFEEFAGAALGAFALFSRKGVGSEVIYAIVEASSNQESVQVQELLSLKM